MTSMPAMPMVDWTAMSQSDLNEVLARHERFLAARPNGRRAMLAFHDLSGLDLSGKDLSDADLTGCRLIRARLDGAGLSRANLFGADLRMASMRRVNLTRTDLRGVCLRGADMSDGTLIEADLREGALARCDDNGQHQVVTAPLQRCEAELRSGQLHRICGEGGG